MKELHYLAQTYHCRPSEMMGLDGIAALFLDRAIAYGAEYKAEKPAQETFGAYG